MLSYQSSILYSVYYFFLFLEFVLTDKSTAAVVASLSIILVVILVAISLVWKKLKKKEKYGQRFQAISTSSSQQGKRTGHLFVT